MHIVSSCCGIPMMTMNETAPIIAECRIAGSDLISYSEKGAFYIIADPDFPIFLHGCQPGFLFAPFFTVRLYSYS